MKDDAALERSLAGRQRQLETLDRLSQRFGASLSGALSRNVAEGRRLDTVLETVGRTLLRATLRAASRPLTSALRTAFSSLSTAGDAGNRGGDAFRLGRRIFTRKSDAVRAGRGDRVPDLFPLGRGLGLMGEQGAEAVMPPARGPDGRLGVRAGGASAGRSPSP
jgi:phage-related minor tail protein